MRNKKNMQYSDNHSKINFWIDKENLRISTIIRAAEKKINEIEKKRSKEIEIKNMINKSGIEIGSKIRRISALIDQYNNSGNKKSDLNNICKRYEEIKNLLQNYQTLLQENEEINFYEVKYDAEAHFSDLTKKLTAAQQNIENESDGKENLGDNFNKTSEIRI